MLLVLFTYVTQHTAVLLGNSSTLNKRGENPPRCNRTTPAVFSLANPSVNAQTIFSFSAVMAFHEALKSEYPTADQHQLTVPRKGTSDAAGARRPLVQAEVCINDGQQSASGSTQPKAAPAGCFAMTLSAYNGTPVPHRREQLGEILGGVRFP